MLRAKSIFSTIKLSRILQSARHSPAAQPLLPQVTSSNQFDSQCFNAHQILHLSSRSSNSMLNLLLENDWSAELHNQLEESFHSPITHETVVYVLRKLEQVPDNAWGFYNWARKRDGYLPSSSLYSLLLRLFAKKDSMKKFWITLRKMREEGFCLDDETYLTLSKVFKKERMNNDAVAFKQFYEKMIQENAIDGVVNTVVGVILEEEEQCFDKVESRLMDMKIVLSDNFVIRSLKVLKSQPLKALKFFHWVPKSCEGYKHNTVTYNAMARVLGRGDTIGKFWSLVEEMKNAGFEIDIDTYIKISRHFQKYKLTEEAVKLYEFMMDGPFKPSVQDCSLLLRNMSSSHKLDLSLVFRVVQKYEKSGNVLSKALYDGMHRSFVNAGSFGEAEKIVKAMKDAGYEPDNITYSQLVFGLCKAGRLDEACKILDDMEIEGCTPDIKTWTILIQGHCDAGELGKAFVCFDTMMRKNGGPDADLVDVLMKGFVGQKRVDGAYVFLVEMINKAHVTPWQATYKLLIDSLLGASKLEESMNLLRLMKKHNYPPHAEPFVQYISKFGTVQDAADLLQALSSKQYPSLTAYRNVFESFFKEGRHSEAQDLLYKCPYHVREHQQIGQLFGSAKNGAAAATVAKNTVT